MKAKDKWQDGVARINPHFVLFKRGCFVAELDKGDRATRIRMDVVFKVVV